MGQRDVFAAHYKEVWRDFAHYCRRVRIVRGFG
jgi:hypothetical protein